MDIRRSNWAHAILTFLLTIFGASVLLPLVRAKPATVHEYFSQLSDWIRIGFVFFLCVVFVAAIFKLFSPRLRHLRHLKSHPPAWLAAFLAWLVIAIVDVSVGLGEESYRASIWEWLGYGGGAFLVGASYFGFLSEIADYFHRPKPKTEDIKTVKLHTITKAPWNEIEAWLESDAPARYDFLNNQVVADRVSRLICEGTRSIGIVAPFGAGKTSLVRWVNDRLEGKVISSYRYFVCHHSCWGFETSASAIHDLLRSAISRLSMEIDMFQIDSLPESYRKTFSAGGDWVETISSLILDKPNPMDQFERLSNLLEHIQGRVVFIVEDLDRNDTKSFELQEVLAFLERLKPHLNLSFILTGGLPSSLRIDYAKLCDHIEYLRTIQPEHASALIDRVTTRCLDASVFPHERIANPGRNYEWNPLTSLVLSDYEELSLLQAVASLLSTPRSLRHALGRTIAAWQPLRGEIDFDHLLGVNVLRFGAPECFQFLLRHWDRLRTIPRQGDPFGWDSVSGIREAIVSDWNLTIKKVEWRPAAALRLMEFILPATEYWLVNSSRYPSNESGRQCISYERYWLRALNEAIDESDVRDQEVIRDNKAWLDSPDIKAALVQKLTSSSQYSDVWEYLAESLFPNDVNRVLLLAEHVLRRILQLQGASASHDSQGFVTTWRIANRRVANLSSNRVWLQNRISEAASVSIEMVNALWHYYGSPGRYSILRDEDCEDTRRHALDALRTTLSDGPSLISKLHPLNSSTLYQLVFDPSTNRQKYLVDTASWSWLGPIILDALRECDALAAANCAVLLGARVSGREHIGVDSELLTRFFGDAAIEVIEILDEMIDKLSDRDRSLARNVIIAARQRDADMTMSNGE